jgi:hypothetical protein
MIIHGCNATDGQIGVVSSIEWMPVNMNNTFGELMCLEWNRYS